MRHSEQQVFVSFHVKLDMILLTKKNYFVSEANIIPVWFLFAGNSLLYNRLNNWIKSLKLFNVNIIFHYLKKKVPPN